MLPEIKYLQSKFPLYGYMSDKEKSRVFIWSGEANAIGWYDNNYVVVGWKVVEILKFWDNGVYGSYLHQCLVYAKLLMLHLNLPRLPYILIVPSSNAGYQIHLGLFSDFPDECKKKLDQYQWSKTTPDFPDEGKRKLDQYKRSKTTTDSPDECKKKSDKYQRSMFCNLI